MKRHIYLLLLLFGSGIPVMAQTTLQEVLKSIEQNNKTLIANRQLNESRKLEARTGNYLANPTVELNQLWADKSVGGNSYEFAVVQSLDFPTTYFNKNTLSKLKAQASDFQYAVTRQEVLLQALQTCQEIIYLRQQQSLLNKRQQNAQHLEKLYKERLAKGDANQLEYNKIQLEKINADNASRRNATALNTQLGLLQTLNGGLPIEFTDSLYAALPELPPYDELENAYLQADPTLQNLNAESESAQQEVKVNRSLSLPKFDIGYRRNGGSSETLNGFRIGMSIPLWENRNTVKQAKAQAEYSNINLEDNIQNLKTTLRNLYLQAQTLQASRNEYAETISLQRNDELLSKALENGQISMIEYFVEIGLLYDSIQNYLDIEKEYRNIIAQLMQYKL